MDVSIQAVVLNVADLEKSIDFYRGVFDLPVVSQREGLTALLVNERNRRQVVLLREVSSGALHAGRGTIGPRLLAFEASSLEELALIEERLKKRQAFLRHDQGKNYKAILGVDPDRIEISVATSVTGATLSTEDWQNTELGAAFAID